MPEPEDIADDGTVEVPWPGRAADDWALGLPDTLEVLGIRITKVPLTDLERRCIARALNVVAAFQAMRGEFQEAEDMHRLRDVVCPEGLA